jgi:hypothetical protein
MTRRGASILVVIVSICTLVWVAAMIAHDMVQR